MREPAAVFGGSFDPLHRGHLEIARKVIEDGLYKSVIWIPAARNPLKTFAPKASGEDRLDMIRRTTRDLPWSLVSDIELRRGGRSYTFDTIEAIIHEYQLKESPGLILGDDALRDLHQWKNYRQLLEICTFIVFSRRLSEIDANIARTERKLRQSGAAIHRVSIDPIPISSTDVRMKAARRADISDLVPDSVVEIIRERSLYTDIATVIDSVKDQIRRELSEPRYQHILRVADTAIDLAKRHALPVEEVHLAAVAHDLAREWNVNRMLRFCDVHNIPVSRSMREQPLLLHGPCAAEVLRHEYGVENREITDAVRYHTLGKPGLGKIGQVLYIADYIEPGRTNIDDGFRYTLQNNGLAESCMLVIDDQRDRFGTIAEETRDFYTWLRGN